MKKTLLTLVLGVSCLSISSAQNLIQNGSFETGTAPNETFGYPNDVLITYPAVPGVNLTVNDWSLNLASGWSEFYWYWGAVANQPAQDGSRFMNFTSGAGLTTLESISQSFSVSAGTTYTVSYFERERAAGATLSSWITLGAGSASGSLSQIANGTGAAWTQFSYSFTPDASTTATLNFAQTAWATGLDNGVFLDNVSVVAVPEPSVLALVALGSGWLIRRRKGN